MPKIGKEYLQVNNELIEIDLMYSRKNGFYCKRLPEKVTSLVKIEHKASEKEFMQHLREQLAEYHKLTKQEEKVILIDLAFAMSHIYRPTTNNSRSGKGGMWMKVESIDSHEYGFAFDFLICKKIKAETIEYYHIQHRDGEPFYYRIHPNAVRRMQELPHTEEREAFFVHMANSVDAMAEKICQFLTADDLPALIDSKQKLLG